MTTAVATFLPRGVRVSCELSEADTLESVGAKRVRPHHIHLNWMRAIEFSTARVEGRFGRRWAEFSNIRDLWRKVEHSFDNSSLFLRRKTVEERETDESVTHVFSNR